MNRICTGILKGKEADMMKKVSKIFFLLLALVLILGLSATAFADGTATTGSITINNAVAGQTYTVYRI